MTIDEMKEIYQETRKANVEDIAAPFGLGCSKRRPRHKSNNVIDARWVITWKRVGRNVGVKCRFIVRGFKDNCQDLDVFAGAVSSSGQRFDNAVAAGNFDFILVSFDVSQVCAKGLTFK